MEDAEQKVIFENFTQAVNHLGHRVLSAGMLITVALLVNVGLTINSDLKAKHVTPEDPQQVSNLAMYQGMKAQADVQSLSQKRLQDLQLAVVKACVDHGGIPIFANNNVDCKK